METLKGLSPAKCILLAAELAAQANINDLRILTSVHANIFVPDLIFRLLLTFLPETTSPSIYTPYLQEIAAGAKQLTEEEGIDCSLVEQLSEEKARKRVKKLRLHHIQHPSVPETAADDVLSLFLIHRAHLIDERVGQTQLIPQLVSPFLDRSQYLRTWYISAVLPLVRWNDDYYLQDNENMLALDTIETVQDGMGISRLMAESVQASKEGRATNETVARDLRGLVGPWTYGASQRKRRKLSGGGSQQEESNGQESSEAADQAEDWRNTFEWIVNTAVQDLSLAVKAIDGWDGPADVDMAGQDHNQFGRDTTWNDSLRLNYCQTAFACIYAAEEESYDAIEAAHVILARLADLMDFVPPPDLATSVELLPRIERSSDPLENTSRSALSVDALLNNNHPLTTPDVQAYNLLQMLVYSAYLLNSLGHPLSVLRVAKLRFWSDAIEQSALLQRILRSVEVGPRRDDEQMSQIRDKLLWLHDWNIPASPQGENEDAYGVLGKLSRATLEKEILKVMCATSVRTDLIKHIYIDPPPSEQPLPPHELENFLVHIALNYYDNASNGNRTRGGVKRALDVVTAFSPSFPNSAVFKRITALIHATHALSYYSLTLQKGIPFQPVGIRVAEDPISLIEKVLAQNPQSYTKLDDLIEIARNLVKATASHDKAGSLVFSDTSETESQRLLKAERRTFLMVINAALAEDDFETAYSYVVNRLSSTPADEDPPDDISWRAADAAGRHRPVTPFSDPNKELRRLEQRMELLSKAINLAPPQHMVEAVSAWRRVEEEWKALQDREHAEAEQFDAQGDAIVSSMRSPSLRGGAVGHGRHSSSGMPGSFAAAAAQDDLQLQVQPRRKELGRGAAEEAPMGLFDVATSAAAALSRTYRTARGGKGKGKGGTSPVRTKNQPQIQHSRQVSNASISSGQGNNEGEDGGEEWGWGAEGQDGSDMDSEGEQRRTSHEAERIRKRDMVASAVTGRLASGIGWVLGANPVHQGGEGEQ